MCACTEPDGSGIGAVYVKFGGQTWPKNILTHINTHKPIPFQDNIPSSAIRYQEAFVRWKTKNKGSRFALARLIIILATVVTTTCAGYINLYFVSVS